MYSLAELLEAFPPRRKAASTVTANEGTGNFTAPPVNLTWAELVRREPRLRELYEEACALYRANKRQRNFQNQAWYGYGRHGRYGLRDRVKALVGWDCDDAVLGTREAHDIAYEKIYDALGGR